MCVYGWGGGGGLDGESCVCPFWISGPEAGTFQE